MNTVGKAWIVCMQHYKRGERFQSEEEANAYAEALARRLGGDAVEVFECKANIAAQIPLVKTIEPSTEGQ